MKSEKKFLNKKENEEIQYEQIKQRIKDSNLYEVSKADTYGVPVFNMDLIEIKEDIRKRSYSKYLIPDLFLKNVVNPFLKKYIFVNTLLVPLSYTAVTIIPSKSNGSYSVYSLLYSPDSSIPVSTLSTITISPFAPTSNVAVFVTPPSV